MEHEDKTESHCADGVCEYEPPSIEEDLEFERQALASCTKYDPETCSNEDRQS